MTKEQINKLIKDGELLKVASGNFAALSYCHNCGFNPMFFRLAEDKDKYLYFASNEVFAVIEKIFDYKVSIFIDEKMKEFTTITGNFISLNCTEKNEIDNYCKQLRNDENNTLQQLYPNHLKDRNIIKTVRQNWIISLHFSMVKNLCWLKYSYLGTGKINGSLEFTNAFNKRGIFDPRDTINFQIVLSLKKIEYLNQLIKSDQLKNIPSDEKADHRVKALEYWYKEKAGIEKPLTNKQMRDMGGKRREQAFYSIGYKSKNSATYIKVTDDELKKVAERLKDCPPALTLANIDLTNLQNS